MSNNKSPNNQNTINLPPGKGLPNFFIVGAAKSGTTSLWQMLKDHPQVFMPQDELFKEPGYFSQPLYGVRDYNYYLSLFATAKPEQIRIGEATTSYLTCPDSASKIAEYFQVNQLDGRVIIMLRNPVERAYSLYCWMCQDGYETAHSFKRALQLEPLRKKDESFIRKIYAYLYNYFYFESGLYYEQVKRYFDTLGRDRVLVIISEKMYRDPEAYFTKVEQFLGIEPGYYKELVRENESVRVISPLIQHWLRTYTNTRLRKRKNAQTKKERDWLLKLGQLPLKPFPLKGKLKQTLKERYADDISSLQSLLNEDLSVWDR